MGILPYLAMTGAELECCTQQPEKIAYMACHFSSYGTGLQDLPQALPEGSLLILDDRIPLAGQEAEAICKELQAVMDAFQCSRLLLDLQRSGCDAVVDKILELLPKTVVSEHYAGKRSCPVFLPPVPLTQSLSEYILPWNGREIWLDAAVECTAFTITEKGSNQLPCFSDGVFPFADAELHCRYRIELQEKAARFILHRTKEDVEALLTEAEKLGIANAVGLYQQLQ